MQEEIPPLLRCCIEDISVEFKKFYEDQNEIWYGDKSNNPKVTKIIEFLKDLKVTIGLSGSDKSLYTYPWMTLAVITKYAFKKGVDPQLAYDLADVYAKQQKKPHNGIYMSYVLGTGSNRTTLSRYGISHTEMSLQKLHEGVQGMVGSRQLNYNFQPQDEIRNIIAGYLAD